MEVFPPNLPELEETCPICILTKATYITRGPTIDVYKTPPVFMFHMDFAFFNVEIIRVFTSTFVALCSATSYPFGFLSRSKSPPLDILKFIAIKFRNHDNKVSFILVDEY